MGGVLIMSIRDQEYGASSDLQQLYLFRDEVQVVEVGPVEAENPPTPIPEPSGASASNQHHPVANISGIRRLRARSQNAQDLGWSVHS
jgi:hypothetical protein